MMADGHVFQADGMSADDLLREAGIDPGAKPDPSAPPPPAALIATEEELAAARLTPRCIVKDHTFADVAVLVAPGGTGKTTLLLYEAVCIAVGRPVWGLEVLHPGWTLIVTAEDRRGQIMARLRETLAAMDLTPRERAAAIQGTRVWDVAGLEVRLVQAVDGNVLLTGLADRIIDAYLADPPAVVVFDPLVSFGASEGMVNDNEQAIITAARRIVRGLDCCVRLIHHTGKANARGGTLDQYTGRGGSALPDGSRMTTVLKRYDEDAVIGGLRPPPGCTPAPDAAILIMARAKLSYAPPNLPLIWVRRIGYAFEHFTAAPKLAPEVRRAAKADQVERFLHSELKAGRRHTARTLEGQIDTMGMTRTELRAALIELEVSGRVRSAPLPKGECQGSRKTYLAPANCAAVHGAVDQESDAPESPTAPPSTTAPPYREMEDGAVVPPPSFPPSLDCAASDWRSTAQLAQLDETAPAPDLVEVEV